jgi:putative membrane protein (TIGR04086 family)
MKLVKKYGLCIGYSIGIFMILSFLMTLLSYFNIISYKLVNIFSIAIPIISMIVGGFMLGKRSHKKGWLCGIKISIIYLLIVMLFNLILIHPNYSIKMVIYYLIIVISACFGGMLGINKTKSE